MGLKVYIQGNKWMKDCASVLGIVSAQPICESQTLCNNLRLSRERMYLSDHLNYYNHCWDGNAWISVFDVVELSGPWKYASLSFGGFAKQNYALWNVSVQTREVESTNSGWAWMYFINTHTVPHQHKPAFHSLWLTHLYNQCTHTHSRHLHTGCCMNDCLNLCCHHQYTLTVLQDGHTGNFIQKRKKNFVIIHLWYKLQILLIQKKASLHRKILDFNLHSYTSLLLVPYI